jgi:hypothetical protein
VNHRSAAAAETPAGGAGNARASWRQQGENRAVGGQGSDAWAGESRRWPAAAGSNALRRRQKCQGSRAEGRGARKKKGERIEPRTDLQYERKIGT